MSEESTEMVSSLSSLKKPAKKRTAPKKGTSGATKRTPKKKTTKAKSSSSSANSASTKKSIAKKKSNAKRSTKKSTKKTTTRTRKKSVTRSKPTLRADLKKYAGESYNSEHLISGVTVVLSREGTDILRSALTAVLASKVPFFGDMLNDSVVDDVIGRLTDDYKKVKAAERKGIRAVINWLDGEFEPGAEVENELTSLLTQTEVQKTGIQSATDDNAPEFSMADFDADLAPTPGLKPLR